MLAVNRAAALAQSQASLGVRRKCRNINCGELFFPPLEAFEQGNGLGTLAMEGKLSKEELGRSIVELVLMGCQGQHRGVGRHPGCLVTMSCSPGGSGVPPEGQLSLPGSLSWQSWWSCLCHCPPAGWSLSWGCPRWASRAGPCDTSSWCGPRTWLRDGRVCVSRRGRDNWLSHSDFNGCMRNERYANKLLALSSTRI